MLGFPKATECGRHLPKKAIYAKFNMDNAAKEKFDAEISRIAIVNEVTPKTTTLAVGTWIQGFYVLLVSLKRKEYDPRVIAQLPKLIDQKMVLLLECGGEGQLAVYHGKLICSPWRSLSDCGLQLNGLDLDAAWESLITQIGGIQIEGGNNMMYPRLRVAKDLLSDDGSIFIAIDHNEHLYPIFLAHKCEVLTKFQNEVPQICHDALA